MPHVKIEIGSEFSMQTDNQEEVYGIIFQGFDWTLKEKKTFCFAKNKDFLSDRSTCPTRFPVFSIHFSTNSSHPFPVKSHPKLFRACCLKEHHISVALKNHVCYFCPFVQIQRSSETSTGSSVTKPLKPPGSKFKFNPGKKRSV